MKEHDPSEWMWLELIEWQEVSLIKWGKSIKNFVCYKKDLGFYSENRSHLDTLWGMGKMAKTRC